MNDATEPDEFRRGAEAMRAAVLHIVRPLGQYSDTPEMQAILKLRCELEALICQIPTDWLFEKATQASE